ncbi:MAG: cytochrome b/b6 domain-containing protein [Candidatus Thiodiazotropha sp.]
MKSQSEIKVWDPLVRIFHWTLVSAFIVAWLTEDELMSVHAYAGYLIAGLLAVRLIWGLIGTRHARFSDFVKPPTVVIAYLKDLARLKAKRTLGHNPAGGAMIMALIVMLTLTVVSGLMAYGAEGMGPLMEFYRQQASYGSEFFEEVHEFCAHVTLILVFVHLGGVALGSLLHRENLVRSMFTGRKAG